MGFDFKKIPFSKDLSRLYGFLLTQKQGLYQKNILTVYRVNKPVISVGNLSMGGTGKTPIVEALIEICLQRSLKPCIVSRNYKAQSLGVEKVNLNKPGAALFYGDEPVQIAEKFPQVSVWTGPRKYLTALEAQQKESPDLFIVDDGFQHQALHRDFDIVLIDATSNEVDDQLLPAGRLRENFAALSRAQIVFLTKVNWAQPQRVLELKKKIPANIPVVEVEFQSQLKNSLQSGSRYLLLSGIANSEVFATQAKLLLAKVGVEIAEHLIFMDHCSYDESDLKKINASMIANKVDGIITTEKDFIKLKEFDSLKGKLNCVTVSAHFRQPPKGLYEFIDQISR